MNEDERKALRREIVENRVYYVDAYISSRANRAEGNFTTEQFEQWESEAVRRWNDRFPAMLDFAFYDNRTAPATARGGAS